MTITMAQQLNNKPLSAYGGPIVYEPKSGIYTFPDGSQAKAITRFEDSKPHVVATTTTMSKKPVRYWMAI